MVCCTFCTCTCIILYILTYISPLEGHYGVLIWECLISMRSETIAYFISTVTVILHACVCKYMYMYIHVHPDVGKCYSEASLESLPRSLQSGSWTDRGDHVWRDCRAMDWI